MEGGVEVRCPQCRRFLVEVPAGTRVRPYCRDCAMTFEKVARPEPPVKLARVRVRVVGMS